MLETQHQHRKQEPPLDIQAKGEEIRAEQDSNSPSKDTGASCIWCSRIKLRPLGDEDMILNGPLFQHLFHGDCDCFLENDRLRSSTCGFCRHLNFKHLFNCFLNYEDDHECLNIYSDWYCKEGASNECQFCRLVTTEFQHKDVSEVLLSVMTTWSGEGLLYLQGGEEAQHKMRFRISTQPCAQLGDKVDWNRIRTWPLIPSGKREDLPNEFRVIDVTMNCIVCPKNRVNYVALSYVWGRTSETEFQATLGNIEQLEVEGSLSRIQLPRTIQDAMFTCRQLGRRYLWVDRLCILQDDKDSKHGQVARMDRIYGTAVFTIVALTGSDSHSSLAGVSRSRHTRVKALEWPEFNLMEDPPLLRDLVAASAWNKRGWTFQEELCSHSNLYFTDYGVYYSRHQPERRSWETISECYLNRDTVIPDHITSLRFVEEYSKRSLSFPDDILRACTGVLNRIHGRKHHFGVPIDEFSEGIHWQPLDWTPERRTSLTEIFPSWSWSSAQGPVNFKWCHMIVSLWAHPASSDFGKNDSLQWISGNNTAAHLKSLVLDAGIMGAADFPLDAEFRREDFPLSPSSLSVFEEHDRRRAHERPGRIISFTQIATFSIRNLHYQFSDGRRTFSIWSVQNEFAGGIWLTAPSTEVIKGDNGVFKEEPFEFLALSCEFSSFDMQDIILGAERDDHPSSLATEINEARLDWETLSLLDSVNIMLIVRDQVSGVARRLGIGQVFKKAWLEARPELKAVVLE